MLQQKLFIPLVLSFAAATLLIRNQTQFGNKSKPVAARVSESESATRACRTCGHVSCSCCKSRTVAQKEVACEKCGQAVCRCMG